MNIGRNIKFGLYGQTTISDNCKGFLLRLTETLDALQQDIFKINLNNTNIMVFLKNANLRDKISKEILKHLDFVSNQKEIKDNFIAFYTPNHALSMLLTKYYTFTNVFETFRLKVDSMSETEVGILFAI